MAIEPAEVGTKPAQRTVFVDTFTDGLLGPEVDDGSGRSPTAATSSWNSTPGCWGPMITPSIRGGHEVCTPVAVAGAEVGDAIAIRIKAIDVTSLATSSGNDRRWRAASTATRTARRSAPAAGRSGRRPSSRASGRRRSAAPSAAPTRPRSRSPTATRSHSTRCTRSASPSPQEAAEGFARDARAVRGAARQLGPEPDPHVRAARPGRRWPPACGRSSASSGRRRRSMLPDSHNAGDFGSFLIGAPHRYAVTAQELQEHKTDGHMDIDAVRAGRDPRLPGQGRRRRRLPRRHARDAGRRRDRRPHLRRRRARSRCRSR